MLQRVVDIGKKTGTPTGMHTMESDAALARAKQGMQFIAIGSELRMMSQGRPGDRPRGEPRGGRKDRGPLLIPSTPAQETESA